MIKITEDLANGLAQEVARIKAQEHSRWKAAVEEVSARYKLSPEALEFESCLVSEFLEELLTRMEEA